jgi:hypothetical protein
VGNCLSDKGICIRHQCRHSRLCHETSQRTPPTTFQNPFPEFWNALGQRDKVFRLQRQACQL